MTWPLATCGSKSQNEFWNTTVWYPTPEALASFVKDSS